jgi:hypothetical protein
MHHYAAIESQLNHGNLIDGNRIAVQYHRVIIARDEREK